MVSADEAKIGQDGEPSMSGTFANGADVTGEEPSGDLVRRDHAVLADPSEDLAVSGGDLVTSSGSHLRFPHWGNGRLKIMG